jgi:hypothetical protein
MFERFRLSRLRRPARRLAILALGLMFVVSVTDASPLASLDHLRRDLGALQAGLERIDPGAGEVAARAVEFNAELGDGSAAFRRQSLVTVVHAAARSLDRLVEAYRGAGDERRADDAEALRLSLYGLSARIERLAQPAAPETMVVLRDQSLALLAELVQEIELLAAEPAADAPAGQPAP